MAGGTLMVDTNYGTLDEMSLSEQCDTVSYSAATFYQQNSESDTFN